MGNNRWTQLVAVTGLVLLGAALGAFVTRRVAWVGALVDRTMLEAGPAAAEDEHVHGADDAHDDDHQHGAHDAASEAEHSHGGTTHGTLIDSDPNLLTLSPQALNNIGLTAEYLQPVKLATFRRSISLPGIVTERVGRTRLEVSTPMSGVITHVHAIQGEAVAPGTLLFQIRITAEQLVSSQTEFLQSLGSLDVENREIARLTGITESGALAPKNLLERQYAKEKLEAVIRTHREALRLQGLSERQIDDIAQHRRLLRDLQIVAPQPDSHDADEDELKLTQQPGAGLSQQPTPVPATTPAILTRRSLPADGSTPPPRTTFTAWSAPKSTHPVSADDHSHGASTAPVDSAGPLPLVLQEVRVHKGQTVVAGETLCVLADYSELYIEGQAFDQDVELIAASAARGWHVTALLDKGSESREMISDLEFIYAANQINLETRSLPFYVRLPNKILRDAPSPNGQRFVDWKYRPGRRVTLEVPVEEWSDQIILPVDAIARDGAESFVFRQVGSRLRRVPVHLKYHNQNQAVVDNDGSLRAGEIVAMRAAHQLHMALKNMTSGGVDAHHGHSH